MLLRQYYIYLILGKILTLLSSISFFFNSVSYGEFSEFDVDLVLNNIRLYERRVEKKEGW